jgi:hypothetical protein
MGYMFEYGEQHAPLVGRIQNGNIAPSPSGQGQSSPAYALKIYDRNLLASQRLRNLIPNKILDKTSMLPRPSRLRYLVAVLPC